MNDENLISFKQMSAERQREIASMGGKQCQKNKKRRKALKEQLELILSLPLKDPKAREQIKKLGINLDDIDNQIAMNLRLYQEALSGNVKAYEVIRDTIGEIPTNKIEITETPIIKDDID